MCQFGGFCGFQVCGIWEFQDLGDSAGPRSEEFGDSVGSRCVDFEDFVGSGSEEFGDFRSVGLGDSVGSSSMDLGFLWAPAVWIWGFCGPRAHHDDVLAEDALDAAGAVADGEAGAVGDVGARLGGVIAAVGHWGQGQGHPRGAQSIFAPPRNPLGEGVTSWDPPHLNAGGLDNNRETPP